MRSALIIANTEYIDPGLAQLTAPGKDAEDFARVLKDRNLCNFDDVKVLVNQLSSSVVEALDEFFDQRKPDDLLVIYFSGHGVRDEFGSLFLAVRNTSRSRLRSTAIRSDYIREAMDQSRSKRQVLILDCCNSGAFPQGTKAEAGGIMGLTQAFQGYGRFVLTASDATQFAWEGNKVIGETDNSLFTHFLVKGLEGEADRDGDGKITVDELYDYAFEEVSKVTPKQTPTKSASKVEGDIVLRQFTRIEDIKPVALPDDLISEIEDLRPYVREAAVQNLEKIVKGKNIGLARSAVEALEKIAADDNTTRRVAQMATQVLDSVRQAEQKAEEERSAREEAERLASLKAEEERLDNEKAEAERKAKEEAEKLARAKAEREATEKAVREAAEKVANEKVEKEATERAAVPKAEREVAELAARRKAETDTKEKVVIKERKGTRPSWLISVALAGAIIVLALCGYVGLRFLQPLLVTSTPTGAFTDSPTQTEIHVSPTTVSQPVFTSEPDCSKPEIFCVGFVTDVGRIDDKSFNQTAWEGVQKAKTDKVADWVQYIETTDAKDYDKNIATFGDAGYDVIVTWGFALGDATYTAAEKYPNILFIGGDQFLSKDDTHPDWPLANLVGVVYNEDQSGFLVGALAAMMSKSHSIGAVCGTDAVPPVWRFGEGYKAGAAYEDAKNGTKTEVSVVYHNDVGFDKTFTDPSWGADTANSMIDKGVDVVFGCGGITGNGAVDAAAGRGVYVIGVDTDQYFTLPEAAKFMLSSAMKPETEPVAAIIKLAKDGKFPTGGLYFAPPGYAPFHDIESEVPEEVQAELLDLQEMLANSSLQTNVSPAKP